MKHSCWQSYQKVPRGRHSSRVTACNCIVALKSNKVRTIRQKSQQSKVNTSDSATKGLEVNVTD